MGYCRKCGRLLDGDDRFCPECGAPASSVRENLSGSRREVWEGFVHKCPNCGAPLGSFDVYCPACGGELRDKEVANSVAELSEKLDQIESERNESRNRRGLFARIADSNVVSDIDQRKINLIRTYPIPNTVEDILEFVILASSNIESGEYNAYSASVSGEALSEAWITKCNQAIHKAEVSFGESPLVEEMRKIRAGKLKSVRAAKTRHIRNLALVIVGSFLLMALFGVLNMLTEPGRTSEEVARLEQIVDSIEQDLESGEYYRALLNAESLDASEHVSEEAQRQWDVNREYWVEKVLDVASENGVDLSARASELDGGRNESDISSSAGFVEGFMDGLESSQEEIQENIDEFNRIMSGN